MPMEYLLLRRFFWPWIIFFGLVWLGMLILCVQRFVVLASTAETEESKHRRLNEAFLCLVLSGRNRMIKAQLGLHRSLIA